MARARGPQVHDRALRAASASPGGAASRARAACSWSPTTWPTSTPSSWASPASRAGPVHRPGQALPPPALRDPALRPRRLPGPAPAAPTPALCATPATSCGRAARRRSSPRGAPGWGRAAGRVPRGRRAPGPRPGRHGGARGDLGHHRVFRGWRPVGRGPGARGLRAPGPGARQDGRGASAPPSSRAARGPRSRAARADAAGVPVIAHAAPPPPVLSAPPVSFGRVAVRLGPGTSARGPGRRAHHRAPAPPPGPRRVSVPVPTGVHPVRVRAIGPGGSRWSATVRVRGLPPLRPARRAHPGLRRPPPAARRRAAGRRHARRSPASTSSTSSPAAARRQRRRPVPRGQHAEGGDPRGRGAARAGRAPGADARPHDHRLRRRAANSVLAALGGGSATRARRR